MVNMIRLSLGLTLFISISMLLGDNDAFAVHKGARTRSPLSISGNEPVPYTGPSIPTVHSLGPGDSIGFTRYDFLTNGSSTRNIINYDDNVISICRMGAIQPGHPDRGTWTACSNDGGMTWPPFTKIESIRTGWGTFAQLADVNGTAVALSHYAAAPETTLNAYTDADRCASVWTGGPSTVAGIWPRIAIGSGFDVHAVYGFPNPPTAILYAHSPDAGVTWDMADVPLFTLPGNVVTADAWNIAAQGTNVAAVSSGQTNGDVILATSPDAGVSWSEQTIYDIDNTLFTAQDVPDGACAVAFDRNGNIHVTWSNFYAAGDGLTYYSIDAGIYHWSAATGVQEIALPLPDTTIVPFAFSREGNFVSAPSLGFDDNNNIFVIYSQFVNQKDVNQNHYEHVYGVASSNGGVTWTTPLDLTPGAFFDASFPSLAENVGVNLHIVYWSDGLAGSALRCALVACGVHPEQDVATMYLQVDKTLLIPPTSETLMSLTHTPGNLNMGIFNDGSIGADNEAFAGPGVSWRGVNGCFVGGPIFGTSGVGSVNGLLGSFTIFGDIVNEASNFAGGFTSDANFDQIASADLNDSGAPVPYGVDILQRSYTNTGEEFGLIRYGFVNTSGSTLSDFYSGIFLDWDVNDFGTNSGGYDAPRHLIYQFDAVGDTYYYGLAGLEGVSGGRATTASPPGDPRTGSFTFITTTDQTIPANGDFRSWIGTGPYEILAGDTAWITFGIVAGDDLSQVQANTDAALAKAIAVGFIPPVSVDEDDRGIPSEFSLSQNYPNPFNPETAISFQLSAVSFVELKVFDVLGREVATLVNEEMAPGTYRKVFSAEGLSSGVYFYRLRAGDCVETKSLMILK